MTFMLGAGVCSGALLQHGGVLVSETDSAGLTNAGGAGTTPALGDDGTQCLFENGDIIGIISRETR